MKQRDDQKIKFLTPEETTVLFKVIARDTQQHNARNKAIFSVAKYCALRASEIGLIRMSDYDPSRKHLFCRRLKGSKSNTIKIVDPLVEQCLTDYYLERCSLPNTLPYLFLSQKGAPINRRTLDVIMKAYCQLAHIPLDKRHFHVLKHTRAMELINYPSIELRDVQWWLGHKSISNTMIYLDYTTKAQEYLFDKLAEIEGENYAHKTPTNNSNP